VRLISSRILYGAALLSLMLLATSTQALAQGATRSFQMALWQSSQDADITTINDFDPPPATGRFVIAMFGVDAVMKTRGYHAADGFHLYSPEEWSRVVAVVFDEPYQRVFKLPDDTYNENSYAGPCQSQATFDLLSNTEAALKARAKELKDLAPTARFWVNFTETEADWILDSACANPMNAITEGENPLNKPYLDVISFDVYTRSFTAGSAGQSIRDKYNKLLSNAGPAQQLALIPGTFSNGGANQSSSETTQGGYIPGYFEYADEKNENCNRSLGGPGLTGNFDRCPVWMVLGWLAHNHTENGVEFVGELDSRNAPTVRKNWTDALALPVRPDLAHQRTRPQALQALMPILQDD